MATPPATDDPPPNIPPPPELPPQGIGPHFEINESGQIDLAPPEALDQAGNYLPTLRALHPELRAMAAALSRRLPKGNNTHALLGDRIAAYAALIDQDLAGVDFRRLYMAGLRLRNGLAATDTAIAAGDAPILNAEAREEIDSVLEAHGPFIMSSQAGREAVAAAAAYERQPEQEQTYRAAALEFADALKANPEVITLAAAETVKDAAGDIGEGAQPERSAVVGQSVLRSAMITAIGGATIFALPATVGGLIAGWPGAAGGSLIGLLGVEALKKTKAFQDSISPVIRASDALSHGELPSNWAEFRAKLAPLHGFVTASTQLLRRLRTARFDDEVIERNIAWIEEQWRLPEAFDKTVTDKPAIDGEAIFRNTPPPEFSQAAAETMILAGQQPPETWRTLITQLGFGRYGLNADGSSVRRKDGFQTRINLTLLTPLLGLQRLALMEMQVTDLAPLNRLALLQGLDLNNTEVSDLTPLSNLASLRRLHLNNTQASDLAPLRSLTSLQVLRLNNTQVSDLAPLSTLAMLQTLCLDNTQVSDLTPLSGLAGLQRLDLDNTQVSDLAPLSGIAGLRELYLDNTQVIDLAPLSGITGLRELYLDNTQATTQSIRALKAANPQLTIIGKGRRARTRPGPGPVFPTSAGGRAPNTE